MEMAGFGLAQRVFVDRMPPLALDSARSPRESGIKLISFCLGLPNFNYTRDRACD
jgi:hypothetical protein